MENEPTMSTKFTLHFQSSYHSSSQTQIFPEYVFSSPFLNYLSRPLVRLLNNSRTL